MSDSVLAGGFVVVGAAGTLGAVAPPLPQRPARIGRAGHDQNWIVESWHVIPVGLEPTCLRLKVGSTSSCGTGSCVDQEGIEPPAQGLRVPCSTAELLILGGYHSPVMIRPCPAAGVSRRTRAAPPGLEPGTLGLTIRCATNCAMEQSYYAIRKGFEPSFPTLTRWCSTVELSDQLGSRMAMSLRGSVPTLASFRKARNPVKSNPPATALTPPSLHEESNPEPADYETAALPN